MSAVNEPQNWGTYNLIYHQGTDKTYVFVYKVNGVAKNLTNYTATFDIYTETGLTYSRSTGGNGITITGATGTITVYLSAAFMADIPLNRNNFYLQMVSGSGEITPVLDGTLTVVDH